MSLWQRLARGLRRRKTASEAAPPIDPDERLVQLSAELRAKLQRFLVTRSRPYGELLAAREFRLAKNGPGLFRIEAAGASIAIHTEDFLVRTVASGEVEAGGKIQGLLHMSEAALNRAIQEEQKPRRLSVASGSARPGRSGSV